MIEKRLLEMIKSPDQETYLLGMSILMKEEPAIYACLLNYTGYGRVTEVLLQELSKKDIVNIGDTIKYKAMDGVPNMIVTAIKCEPLQRSLATAPSSITSSTAAVTIYAYVTKVSAKYWNKSNQSFVTVEDRLECFEILNKNRDGFRKEPA